MFETLLRGIPQTSRPQIVFDYACLSIEENPEQGKEELITTEKSYHRDTHRHGIMKWSSIVKFRYRHQSNGGILKLSTQLWFQVISQVLHNRNRENTESLTLGSYRPSQRDDSHNTAIQSTRLKFSYNEWVLFWATLYLGLKMSPSAKAFVWKWVWFAWKWSCRMNSFSYHWFRTKTYFDRGKKATRKWPISLPSIICAIWKRVTLENQNTRWQW